MCTASWSAGQGRLSLYFNRDERKTRSAARPPECLQIDGTRMLAAIDPDGGGTWLAVSEWGLCVFLLNHYGAEAAFGKALENPTSRGKLPLRYASIPSRGEAARRLKDEDLTSYHPFLLVLADCKGTEAFSWDGAELASLALPRAFLTTSSFRTREVQSYRISRYDALLGERDSLSEKSRRSLHLDTPHPDPAFNPMMLRADARTQSVSRVELDLHRACLRYQRVLDETRTLGEERGASLDLRSLSSR
ncbi:NRDE family protein [Pelagicoccus sp. NFK12]|uniref:NRDE family protein n=1 Tax=Pelagicoccus enzymogenes TaxID=2773457 RepID=A0A927F9K6_9BACT|nr:NRDE family protein [Pelagicoccus enzymogenes]MBD5780251.1 NRDE family protein [Pelagicoccus enzymogenes]